MRYFTVLLCPDLKPLWVKMTKFCVNELLLKLLEQLAIRRVDQSSRVHGMPPGTLMTEDPSLTFRNGKL